MDSIVNVVALVVGIGLVVLFAWAPGHIARSRDHPKAEAISLCGWLSILLWPLWFVAIVWAHTVPKKAAVGRAFPVYPKGELPSGYKPATPINYAPPARTPAELDAQVDAAMASQRYRVVGVHRDTHKDVTQFYEAESEAQAQRKAELNGVSVTQVDRVTR